MNVWVNGCFDILHVGHVRLFRYAKLLGDRLVVGIDSDNRVRKNKGQNRPINKSVDREEMLRSISYIDDVVVFDTDEELEEALKLHNIGIIVIGDEYRDRINPGEELVDAVAFFKRIGDYSTTNIVKRELK
tara:strand:+ start:1553 stop:1945 length:393 start_codon:yes stop_codon:yes gene_type:complete